MPVDKGLYPYYLFLVLLFHLSGFCFSTLVQYYPQQYRCCSADTPVAPDHPLSPISNASPSAPYSR